MATSKKPPAPDVPPNPELIPTPEVGDVILYYPKGDPKAAPSAAIVTKVETIGRIECFVIPPRSIGEPRMNVWYVHAPELVRKQQWKQLADNGGWGYKRDRVPKDAYDAHREVLQKQSDAREHDRQVREQKEADRAAVLAAKQAAKEAEQLVTADA